jgi:hypothetical protein
MARSALYGSCRTGLARSLSMFFIFIFCSSKFFNITKFKVKKPDFILNIEIKLFYTFLLCGPGRTNWADHQGWSGWPNQVVLCLVDGLGSKPGHG